MKPRSARYFTSNVQGFSIHFGDECKHFKLRNPNSQVAILLEELLARLNIEQKWWSDPRRAKLIEKIGSCLLADGLSVNLWRLSQEFNGEPFEWKTYFDELHIIAAAASGLIDIYGEKIYVRGSAEHHEWICTRRNNAKKGGLAKAAKDALNKNKDLPLALAKLEHSKRMPSYSSMANSSLTLESRSVNDPFSLFIKEKKTPPTTAGKVVGESFNKTEKNIETAIIKIYNGHLPNSVSHLIPKIANCFNSYGQFKDWANQVLSSKAAQEFIKQEDYPRIRSYFIGSLRKELGL